MSSRVNGGNVRKIYEFMKANNEKYSVQMMAQLLEVTRSGYYAWLKDPVSQRE